MRYLIAADTGGTFTDLAVHDTATRKTTFGKTLTNYGDLIAGVIEGLVDTGASASEAAVLKHGTTYVINALIQRQGAKTALLTTAGFRDVLEIGRGNRSVQFDLGFRRQPPLIPRSLRFEVEERVDGDGRIVTPLNVASLQELAAALRTAGVESLAISFLNAYRNPEHEARARDILLTELPGVFITIGSDLSREWVEYERTSTAAANAFIGADMAAYIDHFATELRQRRFNGRIYMMGSNGGVMSTEQAIAQPIAMVESGPVGGCIGASEYALALGLDRIIAFDMGGTTAKCALVDGGRFDVQSTYFVGGYEHGFPIRTPVLDIVEVGAGGGSIAWIDDGGRLKVGPRSAGSTPGPIAFGRGGTEPTVTDANVVLGRIGSDSFLNGRLTLEVEAAATAISSQLCEPLGFSGRQGLQHVAQGILDIAIATMTGAIKEVSTERGRDVREYDLFVFGGGGPLFGAELARSLRIPRVIVPPNPGAFSSFGMLVAEARRDVARTFHEPLTDVAIGALDRLFDVMSEQLRASMQREFDISKLAFDHEAEMRYRGQSHTVRLRLAGPHSLENTKREFERAYSRRYGHVNAGFAIEFLTLHLTGRVPTVRPDIEDVGAQSAAASSAAPASRRSVYFRAAQAWFDTPVLRRADLPVGFQATGPAIIEEYSATTIVGIGDQLEVGRLGELRITCMPAAEAR
jgi:N-methylhydantoinase A